MRAIAGLVEHTLVEGEPRNLPVEITLARGDRIGGSFFLHPLHALRRLGDAGVRGWRERRRLV